MNEKDGGANEQGERCVFFLIAMPISGKRETWVASLAVDWPNDSTGSGDLIYCPVDTKRLKNLRKRILPESQKL